MRKETALGGVLCTLLAFSGTMSAHRLDEYLQATRISLGSDRIVVEMDLTPGADLAALVFASINTDHDGKISEAEGAAYANQVLKEIIVELDGKPERLTLVSSAFPSFQEMNAGIGAIRIQASAVWTAASGSHSLFYQNNHRTDFGAYLVNALIPANREIEITGQERDPLQRGMRLAFNVRKKN